MQLLEDPVTTGFAEGLPYLMTVGNHDQSPNGDATGTTTGFNDFFGVSHFTGRSYYGGNYGSNNDSYFTLFSASGLDFIVVTMEYDTAPDAAVLAWADNLLAAHPNRWAIVSTHNLIGTGNPGSFGAQGQAIYDALKDNPNLFLMVSGHNPGEGRRSDTYNGRVVHTVLADYNRGRTAETAGSGDEVLPGREQDPCEDVLALARSVRGGRGFEQPVHASDRHPASRRLAADRNGDRRRFRFERIRRVAGRSPLTEYEWYATVNDGHSTTTSPIWSFTTR